MNESTHVQSVYKLGVAYHSLRIDRLKMHSVLLLLFVGWATGKLLAKRDIMDANCYHCVHEQITSTADLTQIAQYPHT